MSFFDGVILRCLKSLNGERTIYSIYHLLKGKKTSQTIQDAHLFHLTQYFGVYPSITREALEAIVKNLLENDWIVFSDDERVCLSEIGEDALKKLQNQTPSYLNGLKYHQKDIKFWQKLSLLVQVVSNLVNNETNYIPIQKNKEIHNWLKAFLKKISFERITLGRILYEELVDCLRGEHYLKPAVLVYRLTGFNKIGLTSQQTAEMLNMEHEQYHLEFLNLLHYLLEAVSANETRYPLLHSIQDNSRNNMIMTNSSFKTYQLLKHGYSIEEIAEQRRLRRSTIEDHIVEIALNIIDFSIDDFVDKQKQIKIITAAEQTASKQLKRIRSEVSSANYFEIRLVLAKHGVS